MAQQAIDYAQIKQNQNQLARGYLIWGSVLGRQEMHDEAERLLNQALILFRQLGDNQASESLALSNLGLTALAQANISLAQQHLQSGLKLAQMVESQFSQAIALQGLAHLAVAQGNNMAACNF